MRYHFTHYSVLWSFYIKNWCLIVSHYWVLWSFYHDAASFIAHVTASPNHAKARDKIAQTHVYCVISCTRRVAKWNSTIENLIQSGLFSPFKFNLVFIHHIILFISVSMNLVSQSHECDFKYSKSCSFHTIAFTSCITYQQARQATFSHSSQLLSSHILSSFTVKSSPQSHKYIRVKPFHRLGQQFFFFTFTKSQFSKEECSVCMCYIFEFIFHISLPPTSSCIVGPHM